MRSPYQPPTGLDSSRPHASTVPSAAGLRFDEEFESWGSEDRDFACRAIQMGLEPILLEQPNVIHLKVGRTHWSKMPHDSIVQFLRNKRYLAAKYPDGAMEPSVELVRHCRYDAEERRWSFGPLRSSSIDEVLDEFDTWCRS